MSEERPQPPIRPRPDVEFGLTEQERLYDRVSHQRLMAFLQDEATTVHRVEESHNNYGEFIFLWLSRPGQDRRIWMTFYGAGYHDYRERWVTEEWFWYRGNPLPEAMMQDVTRERAIEQVQARLEDIRPYAQQQTQSKRGQLFETLAELTDEDGAVSELEDLGDLADWLSDEL